MRGFTWDQDMLMFMSPYEGDKQYWISMPTANDPHLYLYKSPISRKCLYVHKDKLLWVPEKFDTPEAFQAEIERMEIIYCLSQL